MRKSIIFTACVVAATFFVSSAALEAQRPGGPGRGGPGPGVGAPGPGAGGGQRMGRGAGRRPGLRLMAMGRQLDLTEEQRSAIRGIREGMRAEVAPMAKALRATAQELRAARQATPADAAKVSELRAKATSLRQQLGEIRAKMRPSVIDVLTPEQKEKLRAARQNRRPRN